jgi:hypothetical protein
MSEKKAVITILGLSDFKAIYSSDIEAIKLKTSHYLNMFDLLCENIPEEYEVVPFYTKEAEKKQKQIFEKYENKIRKYDDCSIDENHFESILKRFNNIIDKYDKVIIDVTNGLRHIPILVTINMIMQNIKQVDKIENIIFGKMKEDSRITNKEFSIYEIIDLKEYLELANLSFILTNFQDNYTISKHIEVKNQKYNQLIKDMNKFSSDVMSLSLENLLDNSARKLKETINNILEKDDILLKKELEMLSSHLDENFVKKSHRYETYFYMAKVLKEKGYLIHSLALVFESIGFYLKSKFQKYNNDLNIYITMKEEQILSTKKLDYYKLTDACRSFLFFDKYENRNDFFNQAQIDIIYQELDKIQDIDKFKKFALRVKKLRNNLLHANSGNKLNNTQNDIDKTLEDFESFCIEKDICSLVELEKEDNKQAMVLNQEENISIKEQIMPNGEIRRVKNLRRKPLVKINKDK